MSPRKVLSLSLSLSLSLVNVGLITTLSVGIAAGQGKSDPSQWGERLLVISPVTGAGTYADPKRPALAPTAAEQARTGRGGVSYRWELSDDGKSALVEFVARDRKALAAILAAAGRPDAKVFERGKHGRAEIEVEFKKLKKDFDLDRFLRGRQ